MKKNIKFLIIFAVAASVLGGVLLLLLYTGNDTDEKTDETSKISVSTDDQGMYEAFILSGQSGPGTLLSKTPSDIKQIDVSNEWGSFTLKLKTEAGETEEKNTIYTLLHYEDLTVNQNSAALVAEAAGSVNFSTFVHDENISLSDFGLDSPRANIKVIFNDGTKAQLWIGSAAPASSGVYLQFGTGKTVYVADEGSINSFLFKVTSLFPTEITKTAENEENEKFSYIQINNDSVKNLKLQRSDGEAIKNKYVLASYNNLFADNQKAEAIIDSIRGLTSTEVAYVKPTPKEIKACGLDKPYATLEAKYPDIDIKLAAAKPDKEDTLFIMSQDKSFIYKIGLSEVPWLSVSHENLLSSYVLEANLDYVTAVSVNDGTKAFNFNIKTTTKNVTDDDGNESQEKTTAVTLNGKTVNTEDFKSFFNSFSSIPYSSFSSEKPKGKPLASIDLEYSTNRKKDTVKFYDNDTYYLVTLNDISAGNIVKSKIDTVINDLKAKI